MINARDLPTVRRQTPASGVADITPIATYHRVPVVPESSIIQKYPPHRIVWR
jgi:hypothetical protein